MNLFLKSLIAEKAVKRGNFTLASGKISDYFIDMSKVTLCSEGMIEISRELANCINFSKINAVGGPALGAVPIVSFLVSDFRVYRGFFVRKNGVIEGAFNSGDKVLMVEDVTTTGDSLLKAVKAVEKAGGIVIELFSIIDRQNGAAELFKKEGYKFNSLLVASDVL